MFLVVCSAVAALACRDIERPADQRGSKPIREQEGPPVILALTCELNGQNKTVSCGAPPTAPAGVSASVIYGSVPGYAQFYPVGLVKDTVAQTWQFTAYVQNLLKQSIGTLNGTTVTGVKVFITDFHATSGTGTVSVANADGIGNFTAPNQPYFNYNQIVAPSGYTSNKLWKFNVPNTVTAVSMSILISTDFPAEQSVTLAPPDTVPSWIHADTNISGPTDSIGGSFTKRMLLVRFRSTATLADRQLAIAHVNGVVVGGSLNPDGSGFYYVQTPDDGTGSKLISAGESLQALPQVESAAPEYFLNQLILKPKDGGDYKNWILDPDSADTAKNNWNLEMIDAPFAWGCDTGAVSAPVGVVDGGFHAPTDLQNNLPSTSYALSPGSAGYHGTYVTSVIAAQGNNGRDITGIMWRASLQIEDPAIDPSTHKFTGATALSVADRVAHLAQNGVRVVNVSFGEEYHKPNNTYRQPSTHDDILTATAIGRQFMEGLRDARKHGLTAPLPLMVIPAGNFAHAPGTSASTDAWWSGLTQLRDSLGDTVLVVGASTKARTVAYFSGVNVTHQYVQIFAPGDDVSVLDGGGNTVKVSGTSIAAPHVTGTAGLVLSFDPNVGSLSTGLGPVETKGLLLAGADSNISPTTGLVRQAGNYPFLNAYQTLKATARRTGAPLCGNRVWQHYDGSNYTISAERGTSSEQLHSGPSLPRITVLHTGRDIDIDNNVGLESGNRITWNPVTRAWDLHTKVASDTAGYGLENYYGAANSPAMWSHAHDTLFTAVGQSGNFVTLGLRVYTSATSFSNVSLFSSDSLDPIGYSPRGNRLLLLGNAGLYTAVPNPSQAFTSLTRIYTKPSNVIIWSVSISEDGAVLMVAEQHTTSPNFCTIKYKSMYTGLQAADDHEGGVQCNLTNGFAPRRVQAGTGYY